MDQLITNLVEQAVMERMQTKESFTALDISNALKSERFPILHRDVSTIVKDIYSSGAISLFDYRRQLIDVVTDGGTKQAQAYLYYHQNARPHDYQLRNQDALPPVPADVARDLLDSVPAGTTGILPRPSQTSHSLSHRRSRGNRRDGALSIPKREVLKMGWSVGMTIALKLENGGLVMDAGCPNAELTVRVWSEGRIRICKRKLNIVSLLAEQARIEAEQGILRIMPDNE